MSKKAKDLYYYAWATAWGPMGAVMGEQGLRRVILPHYQLDELLALLAWESPGAVKDEKPFETLIPLCRAYFNAQEVDFSEILCEMPPAGSLANLVLATCRKIPHGQTRSYLAVAEILNRPDAARPVAAALGKNNIPLVIPCHRITYADGRLGGFSAPGGVQIKHRMLDMEKKSAKKLP